MSDSLSLQTPTPRSAVVALLDDAMVQTALARVNSGAQAPRTVVAVDMHLSFMRAVHGDVKTTAQVVGGGKTMCFCEAQLRNAQGDLVAQAMGTYRAQAR